MSGALAGRTAIITGAARGIGLAIAKRLGEAGANVVVGDIDLDVARDALKDADFDCLVEPLDVTREEDGPRIVDAALARFGRVDILVNNAAILDMTGFDELTMARFHAVLAVNLDSVLTMTKAAVPAIARNGGGRVLNIASVMGLLGAKNSIAYSTAKGGVINLTRCLACELAEKKITVNAIAPGFIDTRMAVNEAGEHEHQTALFKDFYVGHGKIPLARAGLPEEIAGPALFFCGNDSGYVTGQTLLVDGGLSATF
ncbi:MAG: SDR family NAD(P)-dependent oxidoreductase [Alphaproteobacteria bacterium]